MAAEPPRAGEHYDALVLGVGWGGLTAAMQSLMARRLALQSLPPCYP